MEAWLAFIPAFLAVAVSIYGVAASQAAKRGQHKLKDAAATVQQRAQEWTELTETVAVLSGQVDAANERLDAANTRLSDCLHREADHQQETTTQRTRIGKLERRVAELEATP